MKPNNHECIIGKCHKELYEKHDCEQCEKDRKKEAEFRQINNREQKKGHELFAEFANVPLGERAKWLENLVKEAYRAGGIEVYNDFMEVKEEIKKNK